MANSAREIDWGLRLVSAPNCSPIKAVVASPAAKCGCLSRLARKRWLPLTPSSTQSSTARASLRRASSRVAPQAMTLASMGS
ncbi:hypothetical protein D3C76_1732490 [compost metagenome]